MPRRLDLVHRPTPLWRNDALDALVGAEVWVKRDDMTAGAEAGNKIRKLEYLLADALEKESTVVITCGGVQSNHARATALLAASLGLRSVLVLRSDEAVPPRVGNLMLDDLVDADVRLVDAAEYAKHDARMAAIAEELEQRGERPYVIPVGGSNALGSLGYLEAMEEVRQQLDLGLGGGPRGFDAVAHACGSGGTAAGIAVGARAYEVAERTIAVAVCNDRTYFESATARLFRGLEELGAPHRPNRVDITDAFIGPGYGATTDDQLAFIRETARRTGLVVDPVYTGKALFGLSHLEDKPRRVLFVHTGGLPGLLAQSDRFASG